MDNTAHQANPITADYLSRAQQRIPGMNQLLSKRPDQFSMGVWPSYFRKAQGVYVWDLDGRKYMDMSIAGIGANVLGYQDPDVQDAVINVVQSGNSSSLNSPEEVDLAELLCEIHPWADMVRFGRTGGECMAMAVRIARASTGRNLVAFCGYHGWHDWYLAANLGDESRLDEHLMPGLSPLGVPRQLTGTALPYVFNDVASLERIVEEHGDDLAAIVLEPTRGTPPTPEFVATVRRLSDVSGAVFIVDEISAGFRINTGGSHMVLGIRPDLAVFSKALGNGYPIGAVIGKSAFMEASERTFMSSTYWSERIGPTAALAMIHKFRDVDASKHLMKVGRAVQDGWSKAARNAGIPIQVGGLDPLGHFSFIEGDAGVQKAFFIERMLEEGFLASNLFYAMFAHSMDHVDAYLAAATRAFQALANSSDPAVELKGRPAGSGFKRLVD